MLKNLFCATLRDHKLHMIFVNDEFDLNVCYCTLSINYHTTYGTSSIITNSNNRQNCIYININRQN